MFIANRLTISSPEPRAARPLGSGEALGYEVALKSQINFDYIFFLVFKSTFNPIYFRASLIGINKFKPT
jgi:hypothetical protein